MNEEYTGYRKLIVYRISDELAENIYKLTVKFPKSEIYGLTSQIRRAAISVPANIIEGYSRRSKNEFRHFLSIALGSLAEVEYYLDFSKRQGFIDPTSYQEVEDLRKKCGQLLWKLFLSLK